MQRVIVSFCTIALFSFGLSSQLIAAPWTKCKGPYEKSRLKCFDAGDQKKVEACINKAYDALLQCRLKKGRFKDGKDKKGLEKALDVVQEKGEDCRHKCDDDNPAENGDFGPRFICYEKCNKITAAEAQEVTEEFISISDGDEYDKNYKLPAPFENTQAMISKFNEADKKAFDVCKDTADAKKKAKCHGKALKNSKNARKKVSKQIAKDRKDLQKQTDAAYKKMKPEDRDDWKEAMDSQMDNFKEGFEEIVAEGKGQPEWPLYETREE